MTVSYDEELKRSGRIVFTVKGISMRPLFHADEDAIIVVKCDPEALKNLDVVLFLRPSLEDIQYVLHRIVGRRKDGMYLIAGDNCISYDVVAPDDILGIVTTAQRGNKPIKLSGVGYWFYEHLWCAPYRFRFFVLKTRSRIRSLGAKILRRRK